MEPRKNVLDTAALKKSLLNGSTFGNGSFIHDGKGGLRSSGGGSAAIRSNSIAVVESDDIREVGSEFSLSSAAGDGDGNEDIHSEGTLDNKSNSESLLDAHTKIRSRSEVTMSPVSLDDMSVKKIHDLESRGSGRNFADLANLKLRLQKRTFRARQGTIGNNKLNKEVNDLGKRCINQYILERPIGAGSFGTVMLCRDEITNERRAVKIVSQSLQGVAKWSKLQKNQKNVGDIQKEV